MKLPPIALTAPSLCPRCDAPAILADYCIQCALVLRRCGNCQGVAGPFDRHCGFCGCEMIRGERRNPAWRLWLLIALVPLAAGVGYGAWAARSEILHPLPAAPAASAARSAGPTLTYQSQPLGFQYAIPREWSAIDYARSPDPGRTMPYVIVTSAAADQTRAADAKGDLLAARLQSTVLELGRPPLDTSLVSDPTDPKALLTAQVAPVLAAPPAGSRIEVARPVRGLRIGGRPGAEVVLRVVRGDGLVQYLERALIYAPEPGRPAMFVAEALAPAPAWDAGAADIEAVVQSLRFS